jgi:integrase
MKHFESVMASHIEAYLVYRESLGYRANPARYHLLLFDHYLVDNNAGWDDFDAPFFLEMRSRIPLEARTVNGMLSAVRTCFRFLVRRGDLSHDPLKDIPPLKENTIVPFVFSSEQVDQLLDVMSRRIRKSSKYFLIDLAMYLVVLLMARCGMRISEPIGLLRHHYRRDDLSLSIEKTKFGKNRLIPVPKEVATQIENYLSVRETLIPHDDNPYLLAGRGKIRICETTFRYAFKDGLNEMGLAQERKVVGNINFSPPSPHSLRHSFAVNTLKSIREQGRSAQNALPVLATYMGHTNYKFTSVYLRVVDALSRKELVDFSLWQKAKK